MSCLVDLILKNFSGKSVVLLGFGREGQATYSILRKIFPEMDITIADANESVRENPLTIEDQHVVFISGENYLNQLSSFDVIIRSPGIPIWKQMTTFNKKITSQTDLFLQSYSNQVIGITGTKGKSTTSSLIHHILNIAGKDTILAGNIGNPLFHFIDRIKPETKIIAELSSHQLEFLNCAPHIAVFLNLFQEHLDAYPSYDSYQQAKVNIVRFQKKDDFIIYNSEDLLVSEKVEPYLKERQAYSFALHHKVSRGCFIREDWMVFVDENREIPVWKIHQDRFLRGEHNLKNIMAAVNVAMILGVEIEAIEDGIATFKGLEHRLEYVGEFQNIHFYNDSIATIPEACMEAIKAIPKVDTLIAGGFDRGIDYSGLAIFLKGSAVRNLILVGAAGRRIGENLENIESFGKNLFYINRFDDFQPIAFRETRPGYACLLSPAASSYDEFKNFEERGKRYRALVKMK
ncbi:MAG: UDP-N-acetylmuramoyl-L-alanine--D-glutamate ligase [Bacteroidales bacterium]|nr:UDP-N-acetylmuramoyl-L-alanine--D-glutamate ligase [Bacteroidales bacterium]